MEYYLALKRNEFPTHEKIWRGWVFKMVDYRHPMLS
jgi:hypothetical protein